MDTTEKAIPKTIMILYVTVNEKCSVCLFHYRIPDSKYEVYGNEHIVAYSFSVMETLQIMVAM